MGWYSKVSLTDPTDPPGDPKIEDYDKDYVEIGWLPPERENGAPVDKYIIDVREKGKPDWKKVSKFFSCFKTVDYYFAV